MTPRDDVVVHVARLAGDQLDAGDAPRPRPCGRASGRGDVADDPDAFGAGLVVVGLDEAALVGRDADALEAEALACTGGGRWRAARRRQPSVSARAAGDRLEGQLDALRRASRAGDLDAELELRCPAWSASAGSAWRSRRPCPGVMRSRYSTTVTSAPRRRQTEPSSRPMMPAPMTIRCFGTSGRARAPVESTIRFSSISTPGSGEGSEPVAMTMFLASSVGSAPSSALTTTLPGPAMRPKPLTQSTLFFLNRNSMPLVRPVDDVVLLLQHLRQVELRPRRRCRSRRSPCRASLVEFRGVQQRLRRDAADIEAGAAERRRASRRRRPSGPAGRRGWRRCSRRGRPPMMTTSYSAMGQSCRSWGAQMQGGPPPYMGPGRRARHTSHAAPQVNKGRPRSSAGLNAVVARTYVGVKRGRA